jgi:hypothetical protein
MDVLVHYKRGQRWLQSGLKPNLLGGGILERARATSLALLGATTAVGLAIVVIALNQEWPLIAGSSVPPIPPRHMKLGEAKVVAGTGARGGSLPVATGNQGRASSAARNRGLHTGGAGPASESVPGGSADFVVAPSVPATPQGGGSHSPPPHRGSSPATQSPAAAPEAAPAPSTETVSPPPAEPTNAPEPATPPVTASGAPPEESSLPPGSHGNGHAYGRSEGSSSESEEAGGGEEAGDDDGHGGGGYEHGSHGHHYGH